MKYISILRTASLFSLCCTSLHASQTTASAETFFFISPEPLQLYTRHTEDFRIDFTLARFMKLTIPVRRHPGYRCEQHLRNMDKKLHTCLHQNDCIIPLYSSTPHPVTLYGTNSSHTSRELKPWCFLQFFADKLWDETDTTQHAYSMKLTILQYNSIKHSMQTINNTLLTGISVGIDRGNRFAVSGKKITTLRQLPQGYEDISAQIAGRQPSKRLNTLWSNLKNLTTISDFHFELPEAEYTSSRDAQLPFIEVPSSSPETERKQNTKKRTLDQVYS